MDHPLQVAYLNELESLAGEKVSNKTFDGCGAPLFALSSLGLARAIQAITLSSDPVHKEVLEACRAHPEMMTGEERKEVKLIRQVPGMFMKDGAEGVEVLSLKDGRTLVVKIADGSTRSIPAIVAAQLNEWGIKVEIETIKVMGGANVVGEMAATL